MNILALTAEEAAANGKAWVEAIAVILGAIIAQVGILGLAALGAYKTLKKEVPQEITDRLDRQGERIDRVALAAVPKEALKPEALNGGPKTVAEAIQAGPATT